MSLEKEDLLARAIALWGAVLASANTVWMIRRDRRDRGSLRVRATVHVNDFYPSTPSIPDEIAFTVVNDGKRPAYVREPIGIRTNGDSFVIAMFPPSGVSLPVRLDAGESFLFKTPLARIPLDDMRRLGVVDTLGNRWFVPGGDFIAVQRRRLEYQKRPDEIPWRTRLRARAPLWLRL